MTPETHSTWRPTGAPDGSDWAPSCSGACHSWSPRRKHGMELEPLRHSRSLGQRLQPKRSSSHTALHAGSLASGKPHLESALRPPIASLNFKETPSLSVSATPSFESLDLGSSTSTNSPDAPRALGTSTHIATGRASPVERTDLGPPPRSASLPTRRPLAFQGLPRRSVSPGLPRPGTNRPVYVPSDAECAFKRAEAAIQMHRPAASCGQVSPVAQWA